MRANLRVSALSTLGLVVLVTIGASASGVSATPRSTSKTVKLASATQVTRPAALAESSSASPVATATNRADTPEAVAGARALSLVTYPWRTMLPGWRIVFLPPRKGYLALTYRIERRIEVYVRSDRSDEGIAHDIAHELGHAVDVTFNDDASRAEFLRLRNLDPATGWWACNSCGDLQTGAGDFAETFALFAAPRFRFYSELGEVPDVAQVAAIAERVLRPVGALG